MRRKEKFTQISAHSGEEDDIHTTLVEYLSPPCCCCCLVALALIQHGNKLCYSRCCCPYILRRNNNIHSRHKTGCAARLPLQHQQSGNKYNFNHPKEDREEE